MRFTHLFILPLVACSTSPVVMREVRACTSTVEAAMLSNSLAERSDYGDGDVGYEFDMAEEGRAGKLWIDCEADVAVSVSRSWEFSNETRARSFFSDLQLKFSAACASAPNVETNLEGHTMEIREPSGELAEILRSNPLSRVECNDATYNNSLVLRYSEDWNPTTGDNRYWSVEQSSDLPK